MNTNLSIDKTFLDSNLYLRPLQWSDAEAVAQLIYDACAADGDAILAVSADELKHGWQDPQFDIEKDAFAVQTSEGRIVGYAELTNSYGHAILNMDGAWIDVVKRKLALPDEFIQSIFQNFPKAEDFQPIILTKK